MPLSKEKMKEYNKKYYREKIKKDGSRNYKQSNTPPPSIVDDEPTTDVEYSDDEDDDEIQQMTPTPSLKKNYYQQPHNVDTEYDRFLYNREYIPYPNHILPFVQNNLRNIQPTRPMIQQHNLNLPLKYTFL